MLRAVAADADSRPTALERHRAAGSKGASSTARRPVRISTLPRTLNDRANTLAFRGGESADGEFEDISAVQISTRPLRLSAVGSISWELMTKLQFILHPEMSPRFVLRSFELAVSGGASPGARDWPLLDVT